MGATSTQGTGPGAVGIQKGPGNGRNSFVSLLDPHIIYHGHATTDGEGFALVSLPSTMRFKPERLTALVSGKAFVVGKSLDTDGNVEAFAVLAPDGYVFDFVVIDGVTGSFEAVGYLPG